MTQHQWKVTEGVILHSIPYRDADQIITIFTKEYGMLKVYGRGVRSLKRKEQGALSPLMQVEMAYRHGKGEIGSCRDITTLTHFPHTRTSYQALQAACQMLDVVRTTQWPGRNAPSLYILLCSFLDNFDQASDPTVLASSFTLKVLKNEGFLSLNSTCSVCQASLSQYWMVEGELFCSTHAPSIALQFDSEEIQSLNRLMHSRSLKEIAGQAVTPAMHGKIKALFVELAG